MKVKDTYSAYGNKCVKTLGEAIQDRISGQSPDYYDQGLERVHSNQIEALCDILRIIVDSLPETAQLRVAEAFTGIEPLV